MKKIPNSMHGWMSHLVIKNLFVTACLLFSMVASAQQRDPIKTYIAKNPENPVVKLYQADPTNMEVATAVKCAFNLSESREKYNAKEIQDMEQVVSKMEPYAIEVNKLVNTGMSYGKASIVVQEQMKKTPQYPVKPATTTPASDRMSPSSPAPSEKKKEAK